MQARLPRRRLVHPVERAEAEDRLDLRADVEQIARDVVGGHDGLEVHHAGELLEEAPVPVLELVAELLLVLLPRDVDHEPAHHERRALEVDHDVSEIADPDNRAVPMHEAVLEVVRPRVLDAVEELADGALAVVGVDVVGPEGGLVEEGLRREAEQVRRGLAHEREASGGGIGLPDDRVEVTDEGAEPPELAPGAVRAHAATTRGVVGDIDPDGSPYRTATSPSARGSVPASKVPSSSIRIRCA